MEDSSSGLVNIRASVARGSILVRPTQGSRCLSQPEAGYGGGSVGATRGLTSLARAQLISNATAATYELWEDDEGLLKAKGRQHC